MRIMQEETKEEPCPCRDEEAPANMLREQIKEHVLISALSGSITLGEDTWLIDSGASKHMIG